MRSISSLSPHSCFMYDWGNRFSRLPFYGGHSCACSVFSLLWHACPCTTWETSFSGCRFAKNNFLCGWLFSLLQHASCVYDLKNWFFKLPFGKNNFLVGCCYRLPSMLVVCTTEETDFPSWWGVSVVFLSFSQPACCLSFVGLYFLEFVG